MAYTKPGITTTFLGAQNQFIASSNARTIMLLGTFPKGPDVPMVMSPSQIAATYGDPTSVVSVGYTGPYMAFYAQQQAQPQTTGALQFLVCRAGVTRGTYAVVDGSSGTTMTLAGIGSYAGSNSINLKPTITTAGGRVTSVLVQDALTNVTLLSLTDTSIGGGQDLSSNGKIVAALNAAQPLASPASTVQATSGASSIVPTPVTPAYTTVGGVQVYTPIFSAGTDGKGLALTDSAFTNTVGAAGSGGLLDQSLVFRADFIAAGWDAAAIGPLLFAHVSNAITVNQFRILVLGPSQGTPYSTLSTTYVGAGLQSSRLWPLAHDALNVTRHPATQSAWTWDGFIGAAALAGLSAAGGPEQSCINYVLNGFSSIPIAPGNTAPLSEAQKNALAGAGLTVLEQSPTTTGITVRELVSSIPQINTVTGVRNIYSNCTAQAEDDAVARVLVQFLTPLVGRTGGTTASVISSLTVAAQKALSTLSSSIAGYLSVVPYVDTNTGNIICPVIFYRRDPMNYINVTVANTSAP